MMEVVVQRLGARGEGMVDHDGRPTPVACALPGERIEIAASNGKARLIRVIEPSPDRVAPFCPYFGSCGGCRMQHAAPAVYNPWKRDLIVAALRRTGLDAPVSDLVPAHGAGRRRVVFHARFDKGRPLAGFMVAGTHDLIDIDVCPILVPALRDAPEIARRAIRPLRSLGKPLDVQITATLGGLDVDIRGAGKPDAALRLALTETAGALDLARLSIHGDVIVERRALHLRMGQATVTPPPGGFLQATEAGEQALAALVLGALGKSKRALDLFAGCGPFALRIAATRAVHAIDSDKAAIEALSRAARATPGLKPLTSEARDLFRRPLLKHELAPFDALVLDPPRAGAEAQIRQIALAKAPSRIVYVSCDAGTFARDAAILVAAGFRLERVTPVDQFAWSAHVEMVGVFGM